MFLIFRRFVCAAAIVAALGGCYGKPVRHLASDAVLIKVGESNTKDVLTYLGEPDEQVVVAEGVETWTYREYENSMVKKAPLVGKYFGKPDYGTVTLTLTGGVVTDCIYGAWDAEGQSWASDFDWQEEKGD